MLSGRTKLPGNRNACVCNPGLLAIMTRDPACLSDAPLYPLHTSSQGPASHSSNQLSSVSPYCLRSCSSLSLAALTPELSLAGFWSSFRPVASVERSYLLRDLRAHTHVHSAPSLSQHLCLSSQHSSLWEILLFPCLVPQKCKHHKTNLVVFLRQGSAVSYWGLNSNKVRDVQPWQVI